MSAPHLRASIRRTRGPAQSRALASALLLLAAPAGASAADPARPHGPETLAPLLKAGGLIMHVRHAATNHDQADQNVDDLSRCDLQRNLSEKGKTESRVMAQAVAQLDIPLGAALSSPYCRAIDTARLVFGRYRIADDPHAIFFTDKAETDRVNAALHLRLTQRPDDGENTVFVGRTANLDDVTASWPKPEGVMHLFRPPGTDGLDRLGWTEPSDRAASLTGK